MEMGSIDIENRRSYNESTPGEKEKGDNIMRNSIIQKITEKIGGMTVVELRKVLAFVMALLEARK